MSLRRKTTITTRKISANRANARLSKGPATAAGLEQLRAANTRHGLYSQAEAVALTCLGEDPAEFESLRQNLYADSQPASLLERELVDRLARALWRARRTDRMQEGYALRQAREVNNSRNERLHARIMRLKITEEILRALVKSVAREYYITSAADLEKMKNLREDLFVKEMGDIALALFYRLEEPGEDDGDGCQIDDAEKSRRIVAQVKEIFGIGMSDYTRVSAHHGRDPQAGRQESGVTLELRPAPAYGSDGAPSIPEIAENLALELKKHEPPSRFSPAEWEARERPRQLLENILNREVENCVAQRKAMLKESIGGPSLYERAAEIAPDPSNTKSILRLEASNFHQVWRISNLLMTIKRYGHEVENWENAPISQNVDENTGT
jgi:hypothetical protein